MYNFCFHPTKIDLLKVLNDPFTKSKLKPCLHLTWLSRSLWFADTTSLRISVAWCSRFSSPATCPLPDPHCASSWAPCLALCSFLSLSNEQYLGSTWSYLLYNGSAVKNMATLCHEVKGTVVGTYGATRENSWKGLAVWRIGRHFS